MRLVDESHGKGFEEWKNQKRNIHTLVLRLAFSAVIWCWYVRGIPAKGGNVEGKETQRICEAVVRVERVVQEVDDQEGLDVTEPFPFYRYRPTWGKHKSLS